MGGNFGKFWISGGWKIWNLGVQKFGNLGIWEFGILGDWEFGNLGDWEFENLGNWEIWRLEKMGNFHRLKDLKLFSCNVHTHLFLMFTILISVPTALTSFTRGWGRLNSLLRKTFFRTWDICKHILGRQPWVRMDVSIYQPLL